MAGVFRWALVIVGALALAVSWLDERWAAAAWLGLSLFFAAVSGTTGRRGVGAGLLFGLCALAVSFHWAPAMLGRTLQRQEHDVAPYAVFAAIVVWEAIPFALIGWAAASAQARSIPLWTIALGWVALESFWPKIFPWSLAHTQTGFLPLLQAAEVGGAALVSFILVWACLDLGSRIERRDYVPRLATAGALPLLILALALGWWRIHSVDNWAASARTLRVGVVQVDPAFQDAARKMRAATDRLPPVDLLAWPESTLGTYSTAVTGLCDIRRDIEIAHAPFINTESVAGLDEWLLVGGKTFEPGAGDEGPYFQTAYLIDPAGAFVARYFKRELLPIGEYMPLEGSHRWLHDWARLSEYTAAGESDEPVRIGGGVPVGVLLCYEDIVASLSRRTVAQGAEVLVCLINAAAFEEPLSLEQHRRLAMLRAIENRRSLVRSSATGVSCCIAPSGRMLMRLQVHEEGEFAASVPLSAQITAFNHGGHWLPHVAAILAVAYCLSRTVGLRRHGYSTNHADHPGR